MKNYSAILEMYYGNRGSYDTLKPTKEEKIKLNKICSIEKEFLTTLTSNKNAINLYKKLDDAVTELNALNIENSYVEGFRFGVLMAIDVLIGKKDF